MGNFLLQFHSGWRYIVIVVLVVAIAKLLIGWLTNGKWSKLDQGLGAATPLIVDIQMLLGLVLLFTGYRTRPASLIWGTCHNYAYCSCDWTCRVGAG